MVRRSLITLLAISIVTGCAHFNKSSNTSSSTRVSGTERKPKVRLLFIDAANARSEFGYEYERHPGRNREQLHQDEAVFRACGGGDQIATGYAPSALAGVAGFLIEKIIKFAVDKIDKALQKEIKEYTSAFAGSANVSLYQRNARNGPQLQYPCFRLTRATKDEHGTERVYMDLVGAMRIENRETLRVRPLRLYYARRTAKSNDDEIGVAISLAADATWRRTANGRSAKNIVDTVLLTEKLKVSDREGGQTYFKAYGPATWTDWADWDRQWDQSWAKYPAQPLIPWSTYESVKYGGSAAKITVSVAEAGNLPRLLEKGAGLFHDSKDKVAKLIQDAADSLIEGGE